MATPLTLSLVLFRSFLSIQCAAVTTCFHVYKAPPQKPSGRIPMGYFQFITRKIWNGYRVLSIVSCPFHILEFAFSNLPQL